MSHCPIASPFDYDSSLISSHPINNPQYGSVKWLVYPNVDPLRFYSDYILVIATDPRRSSQRSATRNCPRVPLSAGGNRRSRTPHLVNLRAVVPRWFWEEHVLCLFGGTCAMKQYDVHSWWTSKFGISMMCITAKTLFNGLRFSSDSAKKTHTGMGEKHGIPRLR